MIAGARLVLLALGLRHLVAFVYAARRVFELRQGCVVAVWRPLCALFLICFVICFLERLLYLIVAINNSSAVELVF